MKQSEVLALLHKVVEENQQYTTWTVSTPHLVMLVNKAVEAEREACVNLHDHEDVQAPIGNSVWGEAYQEGWIAGVKAYMNAVQARGQE